MAHDHSSETQIKIVRVLIDQTKEYPGNPRCWTIEQKNQVRDSLNTYGFIDPVILSGAKRSFNMILGGHLRIECARELGMTHIPAVYVQLPNAKRERELVLRLNKNTGSWDYDLLKKFEVEMLLKVGFDDSDLAHIWDDLLSVDDDNFDSAQEVKKIKKPQAKTGELYALGSHRLLVGDSTDPAVVQRLMGKEKATLVDTDPPFSIGLDYNGGISGNRNYGGTTNDHMSEEEYTTFLRSLMRNALWAAKKDAHLIFWCDQNWIWRIQTLYRELGIKQQRVCWWLKDNFMVTPTVAFNKAGEAAVYGIIGKPYLAPNITNLHEIMDKEVSTGKRTIEDVIDLFSIWLSKRTASAEMAHPTQKLPSLYEKALRRCSKPGDNILDLTAGSGSLLIAAECLKRRAFVVEKEPIFADLIIRRFEAFTGTKASLLKP